jgi:hypothetical protein
MRGAAADTDAMFSYISPAQRVPKDHPLRLVRQLTDSALQALSPQFERLYSDIGRPSIPPERLLRALLLLYFYGIRSERLLMEQIDYNLLFRWFVGLGMDDAVWDATTFTKNRERHSCACACAYSTASAVLPMPPRPCYNRQYSRSAEGDSFAECAKFGHAPNEVWVGGSDVANRPNCLLCPNNAHMDRSR